LVVSTFYLGKTNQTPSEHFWLTGRYDGNRIVVDFDALKFLRVRGKLRLRSRILNSILHKLCLA
jgi:hypothetical protein